MTESRIPAATDGLRAAIIRLPIFTLRDPDDAYGVNNVDYIPRAAVLALIDAHVATGTA